MTNDVIAGRLTQTGALIQESVRQWVIGALPYNRTNPAAVAHLCRLCAHQLLVLYHNWMNRAVRPLPRQVRRSKAFLQNPIVSQRAADLARVAADIECGNNLRKYLSRDIKVAFTPALAGPRSRVRKDLDLMLNDWGVHHLHISTTLDADGYVVRKRSVLPEPLLFEVFKPHTAYLIDIMQHGDWYLDHVLEILASEWPDEGIIHRLNRQNPEPNLTAEGRKAVRNQHANSQFSHEGRVYMPAGILSSAGTTFAAVHEADKLLAQGEAFEHYLGNDSDWINSPDEPRFQFDMQNEGYVFTATKRRLCGKRVVKSQGWWLV